jgi:hypothetical protein
MVETTLGQGRIKSFTALPEGAVGDVFDELGAEFDVGADNVATAAAEILAIEAGHRRRWICIGRA